MYVISKMERELNKIPNNPTFKKRDDRSYTIDNKLSNQIANTLNRIKGRIDEQLGQSGKLDINEFINFKVARKTGNIPKLDIFNETIETRGLDLTLLIDCSGSMRNIDHKVRDITATIFKALKNCTFINFNVMAFSGDYTDYKCIIDKIENINDCVRIQADSSDCFTPHNLIMDYAVKSLYQSENKKMIIVLTDGHPELRHNEERVEDDISYNLMERSIINAKNMGIPVFCLFYCHIQSTIPIMRRIFRGNLYESSNFEDIEKKLIKELIKSVDMLNK